MESSKDTSKLHNQTPYTDERSLAPTGNLRRKKGATFLESEMEATVIDGNRTEIGSGSHTSACFKAAVACALTGSWLQFERALRAATSLRALMAQCCSRPRALIARGRSRPCAPLSRAPF